MVLLVWGLYFKNDWFSYCKVEKPEKAEIWILCEVLEAELGLDSTDASNYVILSKVTYLPSTSIFSSEKQRP